MSLLKMKNVFMKLILNIYFSAKSKAGFSMVELVTSAAVLIVVGTATARTYAKYLRSSQQMDIKDVMSSLRRDVENGLLNPANLRRSLTHPENSEFLNCFSGAMTNSKHDGELYRGSDDAQRKASVVLASCNSTKADLFYPFVLQTAAGNVISGATNESSGRRSSSASRVLTARGETCLNQQPVAKVADAAATTQIAPEDVEKDKEVGETERCEIEVTTAFRAICPIDTSNGLPAERCATPSTVEFFFSIRQLENGLFFRRGVRFPGFTNMTNSDGSTRERFDAIRVNVMSFMRPDVFECPDGQTFKGFDKNGKIQCGFQDNPCFRKGPEFANWVYKGMNDDGTVECVKPLQGENCATPEHPFRVLRGVLPDGRLDCVDPKISDQGCEDGQVLVNFDKDGAPVCVQSALDNFCRLDQFLVGYDSSGQPRCVDVKTPSGELKRIEGPKCGHQHLNCSYGSANKPAGYIPSCPEGMVFVRRGYQPPRCCATCGWIGQWWCDYVYIECSPETNAKWQ